MLQGYVHPDFGKVADLLRNQISPRNKPGGCSANGLSQRAMCRRHLGWHSQQRW